MNNSGANRINITITPSSRPSTLDTTYAHRSHNSADRSHSLNSSSTSSSSSLDDSYDYTKRKKYGRHVQGLPASAMATVDAVLDRNQNSHHTPMRTVNLYDVDNEEEDDEDEDDNAYMRSKGDIKNTSRGAMTQSHDLGRTAIIPPVEPHRQVKHLNQPMTKNQQSRHLSRARSAQPSSPQRSKPERQDIPDKTGIATSEESISINDALYPPNHHTRGDPIPKLGQANTKSPSSKSSSGQPTPRPLSQEQIRMYRTATCMSELSSDAAITYDDEKQPGYIPNWPLFLPDRETEERIVKKLDWNLLPLLGILYLFSYLDRVNIGNARLFGLEEAVHLTDSQYNM